MIPAFTLLKLGAKPLRNIDDIEKGDRVFFEFYYSSYNKKIFTNDFIEVRDIEGQLFANREYVTPKSLEFNNFQIIKQKYKSK